ncbi:uncharacterized protein LOC108107160 [Drosophila eugracilis]|uniref:uncharacterized protein LOC108107160 n=1 Tax=Drosophila eugracilis TaxID=29029 RepID=UPI0007E83B77|nr:uncharacterized protein LOC108107160 [Drosophila eugracilis]
MPMEKIILLIVAALTCQVRGQCRFNFTDVSRSNGIFTYLDRGTLRPQISSVVGIGVGLAMHCGGGENHRTICTTNSRLQPSLPLTCNAPAPESEVRLYEGDRSQHRDCPATMYSVGHTINGQFVKLYDACYDTRTLRAHYTQASIYPKTIFMPRPEDIQFEPCPVMSPAEARSFFRGAIHRRFNDIYGRAQNYIAPNRLVINRGHLTASSDFLFEPQSRSTFKYVNVVPQFESINSGNWREIERWVMSLRPTDTQMTVRTGAFGTLKLRDSRNKLRPAYLLDAQRNPVPKWMYKIIVRADGTRYVFLTHNDIFHKPPGHQFCTEVQCPIKLNRQLAAGVTFCCNPATFKVPGN